MRNFIFSLIAALIFVGAAAKPAQALGETRAELNIGNQSDKCAYIYVAYNNQHNAGKPGYQSAWLKPGQSHVMVFYSNTFNGSIKVDAVIKNCNPEREIVRRYDYIPLNGRSQLSIHNQGNTVIMRHGP